MDAVFAAQGPIAASAATVRNASDNHTLRAWFSPEAKDQSPAPVGISSRHNRVASAGVVGGMKSVLAVVALAGTATLAAACTGAGAGPDGVSAGGSPVVSASPVSSGTTGVSPPVTAAEVRAAGGVYRLPLPFSSATATPYGVYVSWDVTSYGHATRDVLARIDPASGRITASVLTDGFGQALAAGGSLWVTTGAEVLRLKPATLAVISEVRLGQPGPGPGSLAVAGGALWAAGPAN